MTRPLVVKVGGSTLGDNAAALREIVAMATAGDVPVVVHGGGAEASRWLDAMGIPSRFEQGLRVTDERVLPVVVAVFAGLVNKQFVAALNGMGARAVGLSGADGRIVECRMAAPGLGFVGEPVHIDPAALLALRSAGIIPVLSPIGFVPGPGADQLVNVNADTVAGYIAAVLRARALVFLTDVDGVRDSAGTLIARLSTEEARVLIESGAIAGGMIPKVEACLRAAALGVLVRITDGRGEGALAGLSGGTLFEPAP